MLRGFWHFITHSRQQHREGPPVVVLGMEAHRDDEGFIDPETLGHWDGDTFHFDEPFTFFDGDEPQRMRTLHAEGMAAQLGITKEDVLHAIVNQVPPHAG